MLNKIDKRDFLKTWIGFIVAAVIAGIGSAVVLFFDFSARVKTALASAATTGTAHHHGGDLGDVLNNLSLTMNDKIIIGVIIALVVAFAVTYWALVVESVIKQTRKDGTNTKLFGWLTVFFNLLAAVGYLIYRLTLVQCPECHKLQPRRDTLYCRYCGAEIAKECRKCGTRLSLSENFCHKCGEASR